MNIFAQKSNITLKAVISFILLGLIFFLTFNLGKIYLLKSQNQFKKYVENSEELNKIRIELAVLNEWQSRFVTYDSDRDRYLAKRKIIESISDIKVIKDNVIGEENIALNLDQINQLSLYFDRLIILNESILDIPIGSNIDDILLEYRSLYNVVDYMIDNLIKESIITLNREETKKFVSLIILLLSGFLLIVVVAMALLVNIFARKRTEKLLRKTESYLNNVINSMPSMLVGVDKNGDIININRQSELVCNMSSDQAQGHSLSEIFPELSQYLDEIKKTVRDRRVMEKTKLAYEIAGDMHNVNLTAYPLVTNGIEGAVLRIDDVTKKVRMEEMMMQTEKMLSLGGLAAGIAHEVNNPLAAMLQTSQVVLDRLKRTDVSSNVKTAESLGTDMEVIRSFMEKRKIIKLLEAIHESGVRVAAIVANMLNFARKGAEEFVSYDTKELINRTLDLATVDYNLKKQYDFRSIAVVKDFEEFLPSIKCDVGLLQQVLLNILKNAAQALHEKFDSTNEQGRAQIDINANYDAAKSNVIIKITDNGPGMDDLTRSRLFEPFFTTKDSGVGTGLGMSVSYFIVKDYHGGELLVDSELGIGSTFTIILPVRRGEDG